MLIVCLVIGVTLVPSQAAAAGPMTSDGLSSSDLAEFIEDLLATQRTQYHLVGAAVTVVTDGKIAFSQGYGDADLEQGIAVDPERTVFSLASLAKLFTATAVMQLVESGALDLHTDINRYLGEHPIPATYPEPITLAHLLSHTAGFEERLIGDFTCPGVQPPTLAEFIAQHRPHRVRPPGEAPAYSNEGIDLAGYIVEQVSGLPFATYVQQRIFAPLGMVHSTFAMAAPNFGNEQAKAYTYRQGEFTQVAQDCFNHLPSGGLHGSANDMARFMLMYLQAGQFNDQSILQATTVQQMQEPLYRFDPRVGGNAYGFWESARNGQRILYHFGNVAATYSVMALLPEKQVGLFAVYNSSEGKMPSRILLQNFLDHYYPARPHPLPAPPANFATAPYVGSYAPLDRPFTTLDELGFVMPRSVQVQQAGSGVLVTTGNDMPTTQWSVVAPRLFHQVKGQDLLVFRTDATGRATHLLFDNNPSTAFVRLAWYETPRFTQSLLAMCTLLFLSTFGLWPWSALRRRYSPLRRPPRLWLARALALGMSLCLWLNWGGIQLLVVRNELRYGLSLSLTTVVALGYVGLIMLAGVVVCTILVWKDCHWSLLARIHYTLIAIAGVSFAWLLVYWHLLDLHWLLVS